MKRKSILWLGVVFVFGSIVTYVLAQQIAPAGATGKLADAIALFNDGKLQQAKELLATIAPSEPEYGAAQCYDALCLYELKDFFGFFKAMEAREVREAVSAPEVREDLAFKHIDVLFFYRKFEDVLPRIQVFQKENTNSPRLNAVAEYRMATLFERGMKKTQEASYAKATNEFDKLWAKGKADLEEFLTVAASVHGTNYTALPKRVLQRDIWTARLTLGDEKAALEEVPIEDEAAREKLSFLRVQLYQRLQPENTDRNLQMLGDFLKDFPDSTQRKRVEFGMTGLNFHRGKELCAEADAAERAGDAKGAAEKRTAARLYFTTQRTLQDGVTVDTASGIEASDVLDLREDLLYSYALEKDYATLSSLTSSMTANATAGDANWTMARLYSAILLANQNPPRTAEANAIFDDLLKPGFNGRPDQDRRLITAARWRVHLAIKASDLENARRVIQAVQDSVCAKNLKADFLKDYATYAATPTANSK